MAKMKVDFKQITGLLKSRYEILGLSVAGALAAICFVWGFGTFLGASSHEAEILNDVKRLAAMRDSQGHPPPIDSSKQGSKNLTNWPPVGHKDARFDDMYPLFVSGQIGESYRVEPVLMTLDNEPDGASFQMDYIHKGYHTYQFNTEQTKLYVFSTANKGSSPEPVILVGGKRMVVVTGTFPYHQQIEEYRKALRFDTDDEMFAKGLAPTFEGLNVERRRITFKDGKEVIGPWEPLYMYDPEKDLVRVADRIEKVLKTAVYDDANVDKYHEVMYGASATPLPLLTNGLEYPDIKLPAILNRPQIKIDPTKPGSPKGGGRPPFGPMPVMQMTGKPPTDGEIKIVDFKDLDKYLKEQVAGNINWFSPVGTFHDDPKAAMAPVDPTPPTNKYKPPGTPTPPPPSTSKDDNFRAPKEKPPFPRALVRFVDIDMQPGAFYQYKVAVRLANPNYNQPAGVVAHTGLSAAKELVSKPVETERIWVPDDDYQFFITNRPANYFVSKLVSQKGIDRGGFPADKYVPFEVQRFVEALKDKAGLHYITDWVIAERLVVARGERIGRDCDVQTVVWDSKTEEWHVFGMPVPAKIDPKKFLPPFGLNCNFRPEPPVVLLDFEGGRIKYKPSGKNAGEFSEESAIEALLLMPDMTMKVRNSQDDNNDQEWKNRGPRGNPSAQERREHFETWKERLEKLSTPVVSGKKGLP